jgi:hypothetical protein
MNEERDGLLAALAAADPIDPDAVPAPDRLLLEEIITMEPIITNAVRPSRKRSLIAAATLVAVGGIGLGAVALNDNGTKAADPPVTTAKPQGKVEGIEPAPRTGVFAGSSLQSCIVWNVGNLDLTEYAFDGTVAAIDNGWVSFEVNEWFKGEAGQLVVLNAEMLTAGPDGGVTTSVDEILITEVGQRFLVSGNDGFAGVCNQTQTFTQDEADAWRAQLVGV